MFYTSKAFRNEWDVGIGTFGCRGTYRLIRTAIAGVALTGLLRLGARTVFCWVVSKGRALGLARRKRSPGSGATNSGFFFRG